MVDLPPPRRPISAMRPRRVSRDGPPNWASSSSRARVSSPGARRSSNWASSRFSTGRSGRSSISSATGTLMAPAMRRSSTIEQLPLPASSCARYRSDTFECRASALRDMPRRLRTVRTRSPSRRRYASRSFAVLAALAGLRARFAMESPRDVI